jgi:hypothetical protein
MSINLKPLKGGAILQISTPVSWHTGPLFPPLPMTESLDIYDFHAASPEIQLTVTALVGLVNRGPARIYLLKNSIDEFWLKEIAPELPRKSVEVAVSALLEHLLQTYGGILQGLIIYDPALPATINLATTLAGLRDGLVVSPTQASHLQENGVLLPVLVDLRVHNWKTPLQAYSWAYKHLLPECSGRLVAGLDPKISDCLRSFLVAHRVFIYWLDARNILPCPTQQGWFCERGLLKRILNRFSPGSLHLGWFVNEPLGVRLTSRAALLTLASDYCSNLEIWSNLEAIPHRHKISPTVDGPVAAASELQASVAPLLAEKAPKTYLSFTFSDGDNLQYCQNRLLQLWNNAARGTLPIGWTISPALQQVMPAQAEFFQRTASENDELIAAPSGVAYILPSCFPRIHREFFLRLTAECMQGMGLDLIQVLDSGTLFSMKLMNADLQELFMTQLAPTGLRGIFSGWGNHYPGWSRRSCSTVYQNLGNFGFPLNAQRISRLIRQAAARGNRFINIYLFAWNTTPADLQAVMQQLGEDFSLVKPGHLLQLLEQNK